MYSIQPAREVGANRKKARLLRIQQPSQSVVLKAYSELFADLRSGDIIVINQAATLPASLRGVLERLGQTVELRLVQPLYGNQKPNAHNDFFPDKWKAILLDQQDWRAKTEERTTVPSVLPGDTIVLGQNVRITIERQSKEHAQLVTIHMNTEGVPALRTVLDHGEAIQYSYLNRKVKLEEMQTPFATFPVALEPPSASFPLHWEDLLALKKKNIGVWGLTHGAGISSTGNADLDRLLPFPEPYWIPLATMNAVHKAMSNGNRIVSIGTSATRALEGAWDSGRFKKAFKTQKPIQGVTDFLLGPQSLPKVVSAILMGLPEPDTSHFQLAQAFVSEHLLREALQMASVEGLRQHEFGDQCLLERH